MKSLFNTIRSLNIRTRIRARIDAITGVAALRRELAALRSDVAEDIELLEGSLEDRPDSDDLKSIIDDQIDAFDFTQAFNSAIEDYDFTDHSSIDDMIQQAVKSQIDDIDFAHDMENAVEKEVESAVADLKDELSREAASEIESAVDSKVDDAIESALNCNDALESMLGNMVETALDRSDYKAYLSSMIEAMITNWASTDMLPAFAEAISKRSAAQPQAAEANGHAVDSTFHV